MPENKLDDLELIKKEIIKIKIESDANSNKPRNDCKDASFVSSRNEYDSNGLIDQDKLNGKTPAFRFRNPKDVEQVFRVEKKKDDKNLRFFNSSKIKRRLSFTN